MWSQSQMFFEKIVDNMLGELCLKFGERWSSLALRRAAGSERLEISL